MINKYAPIDVRSGRGLLSRYIEYRTAQRASTDRRRVDQKATLYFPPTASVAVRPTDSVYTLKQWRSQRAALRDWEPKNQVFGIIITTFCPR